MNVTTYLAIKFLSGKRRRFLVSFLTWMAFLGVLISVAAFIVVEAVMVGFSHDIQAKVIGFSPHLSLLLPQGEAVSPQLLETASRRPGVRRAVPLIEGEAILRTEGEQTQGLRLRGIETADHPWADRFQVHFEEGEDWSSLESGKDRLPGILLGAELAKDAGVVSALMEKVELLYPFGQVGPTGEVEPNVRSFRVVGTFKSGYFDFDSKYGLASREELRKLFGDHASEQVGVFLEDAARAEAAKESFRGLPGVERVQSWQERHSRLFSALRLERAGMALVLGLMTLLASFNILSMLMLVVYERRRDLAILQSLGMTETQISGIFYRAGLWIGLFGGLGGVLIGLGLCILLQILRIPLPAPYYVDALPVEWNMPWLVATFLLALLLSLAATWLPAREGRRVTVVEALRYE